MVTGAGNGVGNVIRDGDEPVTVRPKFWRTVFRHLRRAFDIRLLLFWLCATAVPTLLVALPFAGILSKVLDFSAYADKLAQRLDLDALSALVRAYQQNEVAIQSNITLAWICTLLFAPLLTAMASAIFNASEKLPWRTLLVKALMDYGRWFWLHLSAFIVYLLGFGMAIIVALSAEIRAGEYVDANSFANVQIFSRALALLIALMTHFFVEIVRAEYMLDSSLRFPPGAVVRALARGQFLRRVAGYLVVCSMGIGIALLLVLLRQLMSGASWPAMLCTFVFAQCSVAALAWMRTARLFVLTALVEHRAVAQSTIAMNSPGKSYHSRT